MKNFKRAVAISLCALSSLAVHAQHDHAAAKAGDISILQPWARASVAGQSASGGFLVLDNKGSDDRLLSASAAVADQVELHTMKMEGEMMKMMKVEGIDVPAGKTTELKPGGFHVMFINLKAPLKEGTTIPVKLKFRNAGEVTVDMPVKPLATAGQAMQH